MKHYFFSYVRNTSRGDFTFRHSLSKGEHPLAKLIRWNEREAKQTKEDLVRYPAAAMIIFFTMLSWKEITEAEYEQFRRIE